MMRHRWFAVLAIVALVATPVWAGPPTDQLRQAVDEVLRILNDPALKAPARRAERRADLHRVVEPHFEFAETARRVLGRHWRDRTDEERDEFTALFRDLLEQTYASRIDGYIDKYQGERVVFVGESADGDYTRVRTKIVTRRETDIPVDYRMLRRGDRWLVCDLIIEGVSLVDNYRSQFNEIIERSSYRVLVTRIKARLEQLKTANHARMG
jgi:phospholipid transport system substrate-binding protein